MGVEVDDFHNNRSRMLCSGAEIAAALEAYRERALERMEAAPVRRLSM